MQKGWTFDINHWESLPKEFLNGSWKQAKVSSSERTSIPISGGIYMYCVAIPNAKNLNLLQLNTPIYMGIAKNLRTRFLQHLSTKDSLYPAWKCYGSNMNFYYLKIDPYEKQKIQLLYEQPMIDCFGKVVNKIDSVGKNNPIRGNIGKFKDL